MDTSHDPSRPPPPLAGRYQLGALMGRGGMSAVYRAYDAVMERPVAVKVLRDVGTDDTMARRMALEARIVANVDHPSLVRIFDAGCEDGHCFLVMELVEGGTLAQAVEHGALAPAHVARIGAQLADALSAIHAAGFVHRDVKPANVLLPAPSPQPSTQPSTVGGPWTAGQPETVVARLTDFGIARIVDGTRLTSTGLMLGTAPYLSPEQVLGTHVGFPSDVYALGLLLLESLTATQTYPGPAIESAVARLHRQPVVPEALGPRWAALLGSMTAREAADRPTALQAAASLRDLAEGRARAGAASARQSPTRRHASAGPDRRGAGARVDGRPLAAAGGAAGARGAGAPSGRAGAPGARTGGLIGRAGALGGSGRLTRRISGGVGGAAALLVAAVLVNPGTSPFEQRPSTSAPSHGSSSAPHGAPSSSAGRTGSGSPAAVAPGTRSGTGARAGGTARAGSAAVATSGVLVTSSRPQGTAGGVGGRSASASSGSASGTTAAGSTSHKGSGGSGGSGGSHSTVAPGSGGSHSSNGGGHGNGQGNGGGSGGGGNDAGHSGGTAGSPSSSPTSEPTSDPPSTSTTDPSSSTTSPDSTPAPDVTPSGTSSADPTGAISTPESSTSSE